MLTGSEQAEGPRCSNVLLSFNCAQHNFCVPCGQLLCRALVWWLRWCPELQFASGHSQKKNVPRQDPEQAEGNNYCAPAKVQEKRTILMSPVGDQPWSQTVFCLQDLKNDTRDWWSRPSFPAFSLRLEELLPRGLCSLAVACSTLHKRVHFLYGKQSSDCLLCPTLWLFFVIITVLSNETVHWTEKLWTRCSSPPATWWIHSFCFFPFCHLPAWDSWLLPDRWARSLCLSPKWWLVLPPPRT